MYNNSRRSWAVYGNVRFYFVGKCLLRYAHILHLFSFLQKKLFQVLTFFVAHRGIFFLLLEWSFLLLPSVRANSWPHFSQIKLPYWPLFQYWARWGYCHLVISNLCCYDLSTSVIIFRFSGFEQVVGITAAGISLKPLLRR